MGYEEQHIEADRITIEWTCVKCKAEQTSENLDIYIGGGCSGHPEGYCYCPPAKFTFGTQCGKCGINTTINMPGSGY